MSAVVATVGILVLAGLAVLIGMSTDTAAQRVQWREIAHERKERQEDLTAARLERERLQQERQRLAEDLRRMRGQTCEL